MAFQVTEVQKALKGADYPATSEELADHAASNGADDELVDALGELGDETFEAPTDVMAAMEGQLGDDDED